MSENNNDVIIPYDDSEADGDIADIEEAEERTEMIGEHTGGVSDKDTGEIIMPEDTANHESIYEENIGDTLGDFINTLDKNDAALSIQIQSLFGSLEKEGWIIEPKNGGDSFSLRNESKQQSVLIKPISPDDFVAQLKSLLPEV